MPKKNKTKQNKKNNNNNKKNQTIPKMKKWVEDINRQFFERRYINGQHTHEKMLSITNHQGNANQNFNEISPYTCQNS